MVYKTAKMDVLFRSGQSVFTLDDLRVFWGVTNSDHIKSQAKYYVDHKRLFRLRRGIYSITSRPVEFAVAQKLLIPSYISLDTALLLHGVIHQTTKHIHCLAKYHRQITVLKKTYVYHKIGEDILTHPLGIQIQSGWTIASPERAICDWIFLRGEHFFDNLSKINPDLLQRVAGVYHNHSLEKRIGKIIKSL